jgi:hypothetical protein
VTKPPPSLRTTSHFLAGRPSDPTKSSHGAARPVDLALYAGGSIRAPTAARFVVKLLNDCARLAKELASGSCNHCAETISNGRSPMSGWHRRLVLVVDLFVPLAIKVPRESLSTFVTIEWLLVTVCAEMVSHMETTGKAL